MSNNAEQLSRKAWEYIQNGQSDLALQLLHGPMLDPEGEHPELMALYGYCLCTVQKKRKDGIKMCKRAVELDGRNPRAYYLLGMAYLDANTKKLAWNAFFKGSKVDPDYAPIRDVLREMGIRKRPVIPFLPRDNALNVFLGKWRHSLSDNKK